MLTQETKQKINTARDILVGKIPDPKAQVEQITTALIYKFMDDMDKESEEVGGKRSFFTGDYEQYSWTKLLDSSLGNQDRMNLYNEATAKMPQNPKLPQLFRNIFKGYFLPYRDPETLSLFLKKINEFKYDHSEELGNAFEYLLSIMSSQGDAGQFRTPRHIIDFIVSVVDPKKDESILDPACGTAGFLISAYKHILEQNKDKQLNPDEKERLMKNIVGYDISPDMVKLSLVNLYLHGFPDPKILEYDTLTSEEKWNDSYDVILANPPFMSPKGGIVPHKKFKVRANRSEILFVDYITEHLSVDGKAGIIVPEGIIFQGGTAYKELRRWLIEDGYLWAVVSLPSGIFNPYSGVKTSILFLDKKLASKTDSILFAKVEHDGFDLGAQRRVSGKNDLPAALKALISQRDHLEKSIQRMTENSTSNDAIDENTNCLMVLRTELKNNDFNLSGDRYNIPAARGASIWTKVKLGDVCEILNGFAFKSEKYTEDGFRIIRITNVQKGLVIDDNPKFYSIDTKKEVEKYLLQEDDFLISLTGNVGRVGLIPRDLLPACLNQRVGCLRLIDDKRILKRYLFYLLNSNSFENECIKASSGIAQKNLSTEWLKKYEFPLPSIEFQKIIVEELDSYQKIIDGARQITNNWKPLVEIDPEWKKIKLGEICELKSGGTPSRSIERYWGGNIPWYSSGELNNLYTGDSKEFITSDGLKNSNATLFPKGSLLIGMYDTAAFKMSILDREATFNQAICGVKPNNQIDLYFLYLYFLQNRDLYLSQRLGVRQRNLSKGFMENLEIPIPPLDSQNKIVKKIEDERMAIESAKKLIAIYEGRIKDKIEEVWGE